MASTNPIFSFHLTVLYVSDISYFPDTGTFPVIDIAIHFILYQIKAELSITIFAQPPLPCEHLTDILNMGILSDSLVSTPAAFENVENSVETVKNRAIKPCFEAKLSKFSTMIQTISLLD